jgi:Photosynthesis system II assembly factor YCF48
MQKAPKIAIERLRIGTPAANHPDADVLTAFSEQSLPEVERGIVLEHLALCADCRDILALAVPEKDHEMEIVEGSAVGGWFTWPALRWGFVTAGILIAGFGVLQYQKHGQTASVADSKSAPSISAPSITVSETRNEPRSAPAAPEATTERQKAFSSMAKSAQSKPSDDEISKPGFVPAPVPPVSAPRPAGASAEGSAANVLPHGPRMIQNQNNQMNQAQMSQIQSNQIETNQIETNQVQRNKVQMAQQAAVVAQAPANAGAGGNQIHGQATAPAPSPQTLEAMSGRDVTELQPLQSQRLDQQAQDGGSGESKVERVKPLDSITVTTAGKVLRSRPARSADVLPTALGAPSWTISSTGSLQRSFDQGHTWQDVNVHNSPGMDAEAAGTNFSMNLKQSSGAVAQNEKDDADKSKKKMEASIVFRAVAANGPDVWAGGSGSLLFHSTDSGAHWTQIVPFAGNAFLTGDIVSVEFADPQHGKVTTSSPETWMTDDAGKTWRKQ